MRINIGVSPWLLSDQHLIAEYSEVAMPIGHLKKNNFQLRSQPNATMLLRFDHTNFFKDKLLYLQKRKKALVKEMRERGFTVNYPQLLLENVPDEFLNEWRPTINDSMWVRTRIVNRLEDKPDWYRFYGIVIGNSMPMFVKNIYTSPLFKW